MHDGLRGDIVSDFRDLILWQRADELYGIVAVLIKALPYQQQKSLGDQMDRAAVSVVSNIVEGHARRSPKEFLQFLYISKGSLDELVSQLTLYNRVNAGFESDVERAIAKATEVSKLLHVFIKKLKIKVG